MIEKSDILVRLNFRAFYSGRLNKFKARQNGQAMGLCPFHKDKNPSFSVNLENGRFNCFSCEAKGDVFSFYMQRHNVDFVEAKDALAKQAGLTSNSHAPPKSRRKVGTFNFFDKNGQLLYWKERWEPGRNGSKKEFLFFHYEEDKRVLGRGVSEGVLYRLPEVLNSHNVIIVEGEAKADLLAKYKLTATSLDSGAGSKLTHQIVEQLSNKNIALFPDNDDKGKHYMEGLAGRLNGQAKSIKIVSLPNLGPKEDIMDWLKVPTDFDPKEIVDLIESTSKWKLKPKTEEENTKQQFQEQFSAASWLVPSGIFELKNSPTVAQIEPVMQWISRGSSNLNELHRELVRMTVIERLNKLGINKGVARLVDGAIGKKVAASGSHDQEIAFESPVPAAHPVSGNELLNIIADFIPRFAVLPSGAKDCLALWVLHTYCMDAAKHSPILVFTSPEARCGKSLTLELIEGFVKKPLLTSNITSASLFRVIEKYTPTLIVDEADTFLPKNEELRGIINSGHKRGGAVLRCTGDNNEVQRFSTWSPKVLAQISKAGCLLPDTIEDRSILFPLKRKRDTDKVERLDIDRFESFFRKTRSQCERWAIDNLESLKNQYPDVPDSLNDRQRDSWRVLLSIADLAGEDWPKRAFESAKILSGNADEKEATDSVKLLADLRDLFALEEKDQLSSTFIVERLAEMEDRPWVEWRHDKPLTQRQLSSLLKPFGVNPTQFRDGGKIYRGYSPSDLQDPFSRYLDSGSVTSGTTQY